jgi:hypothetical protein
MNYEYRIVAFIDILAFSEMIKATDTDDPKKEDDAKAMLDKLQEVVKFLQTDISKAISKHDLPSGTKASMFSDTVVVSIPKAESRGVWRLFQLLKKLQIKLIGNDILLRGGIVHGKLIHQDQLIIGPALVNAYEVESKSALYPRIVIDPHVLHLYVRKNGVSISNLRLSDKDDGRTIKKDLDGTSYIDYFNLLEDYYDGNVTKYFAHLNELIRKGMNRKFGTGIRMKYMWMKEKVNTSKYSDEIKSAGKKKLKGRS